MAFTAQPKINSHSQIFIFLWFMPSLCVHSPLIHSMTARLAYLSGGSRRSPELPRTGILRQFYCPNIKVFARFCNFWLQLFWIQYAGLLVPNDCMPARRLELPTLGLQGRHSSYCALQISFNCILTLKKIISWKRRLMHKNMNTPLKRIETHFAFRTILIKMTPTVFSLI